MDGLLRLPRTANNSAQWIIQCLTIKIRLGPHVQNREGAGPDGDVVLRRII
jgi:hypothetical protein